MFKRGHFVSEKLIYGVIILMVAAIFVMSYEYMSQKNTAPEGTAIASINKASTTVLKSLDASALVIVPAGTQTTTKEISIKSVEKSVIDSKKRASKIYQLGPSKAKFKSPVELRIKYNIAIVGDCPDLIDLYHYNEDGSIKEYVASKQVYCSSHIAAFAIDSFSFVYAGKAVRDEDINQG